MRQYIQYIFLVLSFGSVSDFLEMSKFAWILLVIAFDPTGQNEISVQDVSFFFNPIFCPLLARFKAAHVLAETKKSVILILTTDAFCCFSTVVAVVP